MIHNIINKETITYSLFFEYFILINLLFIMFKLIYTTVRDFSSTSFIFGFMLSRFFSNLSISDITIDCFYYLRDNVYIRLNQFKDENIYFNWIFFNGNPPFKYEYNTSQIKNEFKDIFKKINSLSSSSCNTIFKYVNKTLDTIPNPNSSPIINTETSDNLVEENHNTSPNNDNETSDNLVEENHDTSPDNLNHNLGDNILSKLDDSTN